jgi:hypothetical protein
MVDSGQLKKLTIKAYEKPDYTDKSVAEFSAYVNPGEITLSYEIEYNSAQGAGTTNSRMEFNKQKPGDMTLTFYIDGTGVDGSPAIDVQKKIEEFQNVTGYSGSIHRPRYLKVVWGTLQVKKCVLKSASIVYKLFKPNGIPLRAVITAVFSDNSDDQTRVAMVRDESADLFHLHLVKEGDTLPALCYEIYGDPGYYLEVAQANHLNDFRQLNPGSRIFFPPLER